MPEAHNNLGALYVQAHDYEGAIAALERALALYPLFAKAYLNLGNALKGAQRYKEAEEAYKRALELDPQEYAGLFNLGVLYLDNKIEGVDRLERWSIAKANFTKYLSSVSNLSEEEKTKLASYQVESDRGLKREQRRIKSEERRAKRKARKKAKKEAAEKKAAEEKAAQDAANKDGATGAETKSE